jgi:D-alanyl-lipoteichoic acid acyltransferase DltB (MBOAT superfamily)
MNFADLRFWQILAAGLLLWIAVRGLARLLGKRWELDRHVLALHSLILHIAVGWKTIVKFLYVALMTYFILLFARRWRMPERPLLFLLVPLQVAPMLYYKYGGFVANDLLHLNRLEFHQLIIPAGISFYTFQKISFVIDTLHFRKPLPSFLNYLNYASFFPQIVAGPIERREDLLPQASRFQLRFKTEDFARGLPWMILGFFFKSGLADNLAQTFPRAEVANAYRIWYTNFLFAFRIYFDFAGYSFIAFGLARCLGVNLTLNFSSPYYAANVADFWHRWHVSLSQWFRDYLYIPLGGGRGRLWWCNILIVFVISGIWHGAGWNFILWGFLHGLFLIAYRLFPFPLPSAGGRMLTFGVVLFSWLFFYETDFQLLVQKLETLVSPTAYGFAQLGGMANYFLKPEGLLSLVLVACSLMVMGVEASCFRNNGKPYRIFLSPWALVAMIVFTIWMAPGKNNSFIYFAF